MRIPFSTIPDTALEDETALRSPRRTHQFDEDYELWLQRERQFKVLAENTHRQKGLPPSHLPSGAAGWTGKTRAKSRQSTTADLF